MTSLTRLFLAALAAVMLTFAALPATAAPLTTEQEKAVEEVIQRYLRENPEIIMEALGILRQRQQAAEEKRVQETLATRREQLVNDPDTPAGGNPDGAVAIVEFFDYQCGYCKRVLPVIQAFIEDHDDVRLVMKEFPVLGEASVVAARAALAVWKLAPGKYMEFHTTLMSSKGRLTDERIDAVAEQVGVDPAELHAAMSEAWIGKQLRETRALAQDLGFNGTPSFVIGDELIPGALNREVLEQAVAAARKER